MKYRATILSFLRQRLYAAKAGVLIDSKAKVVMIEKMLRDFDLIRSMSEKRHALEIWKKHPHLIDLLPSEHGKHAKYRKRILELILESQTIAKTIQHDIRNSTHRQYH